MMFGHMSDLPEPLREMLKKAMEEHDNAHTREEAQLDQERELARDVKFEISAYEWVPLRLAFMAWIEGQTVHDAGPWSLEGLFKIFQIVKEVEDRADAAWHARREELGLDKSKDSV